MRLVHSFRFLGTLTLASCSVLQQSAPLVNRPIRTDKSSEIAHISVAATNVAPWDDMADDLNRTQFNLTAEQYLQEAVQVTSSVNAQSMDYFAASLAAAFSGTSVTRTDNQSTDAQGAVTNTQTVQRQHQTPEAPKEVTINFQAPSISGTSAADASGATAGIEAQQKFDVAKALAEEVAIKNREISTLVQQTGYRPYFVNLKVAVEPFDRRYPYDTFLDLKFETASGTPIVVPLLVTDAMESTREAQTTQVVRQLGAALRGSAGFVGASASLQRTLARLDQTLADRANSLLTVAQNGGNGVRVRLGANAYGENYELISRTHSVSIIILIPLAIAQSLDKDARLVRMSGTVFYRDAGGWRAPKETRFPADKVPLEGLVPFQIPRRLAPKCPFGQDAVVYVIPVTPSATAGASNVDNVVLIGGEGLQGRAIKADIEGSGPGRGQKVHFRTTAAGTLRGVEMSFPDHTAFIGGSPGELRTATLKLQIEEADSEPALACPKDGEKYRLVYPMIPKPPKPSPEKPAKAATPKSPHAAAGTGSVETLESPQFFSAPVAQPVSAGPRQSAPPPPVVVPPK